MAVDKRKLSRGVRWRFRGQYLGVKYGSSAIYLTKQEALKAKRPKKAEIEEKLKNPNTVNLFDLITERLDQLKIQKSGKYYLDNKYYFQRFFKFLGNIKVSEITRR